MFCIPYESQDALSIHLLKTMLPNSACDANLMPILRHDANSMPTLGCDANMMAAYMCGTVGHWSEPPLPIRMAWRPARTHSMPTANTRVWTGSLPRANAC